MEAAAKAKFEPIEDMRFTNTYLRRLVACPLS
jgi:hypothetical protein